jgi:hypothetical protein
VFVRVATWLLVLCLALAASLPVLAQESTGGWQSAGTGQVDSTYIGAIDAPADGATIPLQPLDLSGWFVDTSAQGWAGADGVQVFQGPMSSGVMLAQGEVGRDRPDVAAALNNPFWATSGWTATIDWSRLPVGQVQITVNLHTPGKGWWAHPLMLTVGPTSGEILAPAPGAQGSVPRLSVFTPQPDEAVSTSNRQYFITGSATDPARPVGGVDLVEVWLNGEANTQNATLLGITDVAADGTWSLTFDPAQFEPTPVNLYAYAHSAISGRRTAVVVHFQITNRR